MISMERAACIMDAATDAWEDARAAEVGPLGAGESLEVARNCFERGDWTGAWLAAGSVLGVLADRLTPGASAA